jgi:hypothetical protein
MIPTSSILEILDEWPEEAEELDRGWARQVREPLRELPVKLPT